MEKVLGVVLDGCYRYGFVSTKNAASRILMASIFPLNVFKFWSHSVSLRHIHGSLANNVRSQAFLGINRPRYIFFQLYLKSIL